VHEGKRRKNLIIFSTYPLWRELKQNLASSFNPLCYLNIPFWGFESRVQNECLMNKDFFLGPEVTALKPTHQSTVVTIGRTKSLCAPDYKIKNYNNVQTVPCQSLDIY
jgi:hypothetical protein